MYRNETYMYIRAIVLDGYLFLMYNKERKEGRKEQEDKICINLHFPTSE